MKLKKKFFQNWGKLEKNSKKNWKKIVYFFFLLTVLCGLKKKKAVTEIIVPSFPTLFWDSCVACAKYCREHTRIPYSAVVHCKKFRWHFWRDFGTLENFLKWWVRYLIRHLVFYESFLIIFRSVSACIIIHTNGNILHFVNVPHNVHFNTNCGHFMRAHHQYLYRFIICNVDIFHRLLHNCDQNVAGQKHHDANDFSQRKHMDHSFGYDEYSSKWKSKLEDIILFY